MAISVLGNLIFSVFVSFYVLLNVCCGEVDFPGHIIKFGASYSATGKGQDVNGGWGPWSKYPSACNKPCGGGKTNYTRVCSNPVPQGNGQSCPGDPVEQRECNVEQCKTSWSEWSSCDATCDIGVVKRRTMCGEEDCTDSQLQEQSRECVDWDQSTCPSPCLKSRCPEYAKCADSSNSTRPMYQCVCVMGYAMDDKGKCSRPLPPPPTTRAIPTMNTEEKKVAIVITRTASTILLIMVGITLFIFLVLRVFTVDRVIQMNMEIALECAHLLLLFPNSMADGNPNLCRGFSMGLQYCFTACFAFMLLESIQMYSMVSFVVQKDGLMTRFQNFLTGWGISAVILLFTVCFHFEEYGGEYHCWLRMDTPLLYGQVIPVTLLMIMTIVMTEAAGSANYKSLENVDYQQLFSAKISQRSNMILCVLIYASWILGMLSDYEQNLALYSVFSGFNTCIGIAVFLTHSLGNHEIRRKLRSCFSCCC